MHTSDFDYRLPPQRIAQASVLPRDHSRLMVVKRQKRMVEHRHFYDIVEYVREGDMIVWNDSKVFKARLFGFLISKDGKPLREHAKPVEIFLVRPMENPGVWKVLARPGKHVQVGTRIVFAEDFFCDALVKNPDGTILVQFEDNEEVVRAKANRVGSVPLPPYVKDEKHELEEYQNVYAKTEGSVAAPTAGFHFTTDLIRKMQQNGVEFASISLHVGLGTFLPMKTERINDHVMHSEWVCMSDETARRINEAKANGRRVIAVGTTTVRTLEGIAELYGGVLKSYTGDINTFITPGFTFRIVDALITNFHLPKSTLLMLVAAFVGDTQRTLDLYQEAIAQQYRFYSFGDAMFVW